ncbi:MAG: SOS response-associated peptidase family protein [Saprospiraceae bacterium]|nr:SOS response-associated peptidase family protein [Saprospiraceae bacterium]
MLIERLSLKFSGDYIKKELEDRSLSVPTRPNYNIHIGHACLVLNVHEGQWKVGQMMWGFGSGRATGQRIINARSEGILGQPSFRFAIRSNRLVIPVDSFYVEKITGQSRKVHRVVPYSDSLMYIAGIWEPVDQKTNGFAVLTVKSNKDLLQLTHRMPLIFFDVQSAMNWCRPMTVGQINEWIGGTASSRLRHYQVSDRVMADINAPMLHEPVQEHLTLFD